eukprot:4412563-Amphidinium_carterae.1
MDPGQLSAGFSRTDLRSWRNISYRALEQLSVPVPLFGRQGGVPSRVSWSSAIGDNNHNHTEDDDNDPCKPKTR